MKILKRSRYALSTGAIAALLAGCVEAHGGLALPYSDAKVANTLQFSRPNAASSEYKVLYSFKAGKDGSLPLAALIEKGGVLYGVTSIGGSHACYAFGCGTIFTMTTDGKTEHIFYHFGGVHGENPTSGLLPRAGQMYGTTGGGGTSCGPQCGTVYKIDSAGEETVLHTFHGDPSDGSYPSGGLIYWRGHLYGTAYMGGSDSGGTVFVVNLSGNEKTLHAFKGGRDGEWPTAPLINFNGVFYGTTSQGGSDRGCSSQVGAAGCGTIFTITPSGSEQVVYRFRQGRDGFAPQGGLINIGGLFYGTTYYGGFKGSGCPAGCGTFYSFNPQSHQVQVIYRFKGIPDGEQPAGQFVNVHNTLYGITTLGGTGSCDALLPGCGTVYSLTTSGVESVLHSFQGAPQDGAFPSGGPLLDLKGTFYGATGEGGRFCRQALVKGCGVVFALTP